ncbi:MAG: division/cell wall cluster transcriptional repressor MraZ [Rickettsiales bacterium]|nr:division/cell wall cluster transcriptional repressor MraZ [Rickettsiales bacterium]
MVQNTIKSHIIPIINLFGNNMALFLSTTLNKIDSKSRVSVPSNYRSTLNKQSFKGIIAFPSYTLNCLDSCGIDRMEAIADNLDQNDDYSKEEFDLISLYFSEAEKIPFDKEGRIIIPKRLLDHTSIKDQVLFVGLGPTFQIWEPKSYDNQKKRTIQKALERNLNPRLSPIPRGI